MSTVSGKAYKGMGMEGFNADFHEGDAAHMLLKRAYTRAEFDQFLTRTPFRPIEIKEDLMGLELTLHRTA